ncbi:MAG: hypothetical protein V4509_01685 [Patescibacteria group bacterium]
MYKIKDTQFSDKYLGDGQLFETLDEVRDRLIGFHFVDVDPESLEKATLAELCDFEWEIQTEDGEPVDIEELKKIRHTHVYKDGSCACGELELF